MVANTFDRLRPRKALGQYFLLNCAILDRIVDAAELAPEDIVLEIGPGEGALTRRLLQHAALVVAVEMDPNLARLLSPRLDSPPNLATVQADARTADLVTLVRQQTPYKLVSNLPYYAANPIIRRFLEAAHKPESMVAMVQLEVAKTMVAPPGEMSILSVAIQYYARPEIVCIVPPSAFRPRPKVKSAVVRLKPMTRPSVVVDDEKGFFQIVRAGFSTPRKKLRNSLSYGLSLPAKEIDQLLASAPIDGKRRPETLSVAEWAQIYHVWGPASSRGQLTG